MMVLSPQPRGPGWPPAPPRAVSAGAAAPGVVSSSFWSRAGSRDWASRGAASQILTIMVSARGYVMDAGGLPGAGSLPAAGGFQAAGGFCGGGGLPTFPDQRDVIATAPAAATVRTRVTAGGRPHTASGRRGPDAFATHADSGGEVSGWCGGGLAVVLFGSRSVSLSRGFLRRLTYRRGSPIASQCAAVHLSRRAVAAGGRWRVMVRSAPCRSKIATDAAVMGEMCRFATAESPECGTLVQSVGAVLGIWEGQPADGHGSRHAGRWRRSASLTRQVTVRGGLRRPCAAVRRPPSGGERAPRPSAVSGRPGVARLRPCAVSRLPGAARLPDVQPRLAGLACAYPTSPAESRAAAWERPDQDQLRLSDIVSRAAASRGWSMRGAAAGGLAEDRVASDCAVLCQRGKRGARADWWRVGRLRPDLRRVGGVGGRRGVGAGLCRVGRLCPCGVVRGLWRVGRFRQRGAERGLRCVGGVGGRRGAGAGSWRVGCLRQRGAERGLWRVGGVGGRCGGRAGLWRVGRLRPWGVFGFGAGRS